MIFNQYLFIKHIGMFLFRGSILGRAGSLPIFKGLNLYSFGVVKFKLPDLGQKIKEGTIKKIYIKEGDTVEEFQKIADVASDKQFTQITASNHGTIKKIYYKEEEVCQVGDLFLEIQVQDQGESDSKSTKKNTSKDSKPAPKSSEEPKAKESSTILATPYVKGLIKKHGLDINNIQGSGQSGRILQEDVEKLLKKHKQPEKEAKEKRQDKVAHKPHKAQQHAKSASHSSTNENVTTHTMNGYEKGMQKSMTESNTIPHLYLHEEFDITEVEKLRKTLKQSNKKITVMGILIKTFSLALKQFPKINSQYHPESNPYEYSIYPNHNISIAIDSPNGLVVPHIKNVNHINLLEIQNQLEKLRNLAKEAKLTAKELQGGTVCLSNIGTIGGTHACPLILPPQVCIVAIGKLQSVPKYRGGELVQRKVLTVSFGCDHRVVDGATVARFSNCWKQFIENPYLALAEMI